MKGRAKRDGGPDGVWGRARSRCAGPGDHPKAVDLCGRDDLLLGPALGEVVQALQKAETGDGWRLVPDEYGLNTAGTLREIVRRIIDGESANSVCRWLNENLDKTPASVDAQRIRSGQDSKGSRWTASNLAKIVRSPTLLGQVAMTEDVTLSDGRTEKRTRLVRYEDGLPLQRAEPLISHEDWERAALKLSENVSKRTGNRTGGSLLLRVAFCGCGEPVYRAPGRNWPYYRCASRVTHKPCGTGNKGISAALLESTVEEEFLRVAGDIEIVRRVFRPGVDHTKDIEEVTRALAELREDRQAGLYSSETGKQEYREAYARLDAKREQLMSLPTRPDTWEELPTGETYQERWARLSTGEEKGKELRSAGLKVTVHTEDIPPAYVGGRLLVTLDEGKMGQRLGRVEIEFPRDFSRFLRGTPGLQSREESHPWPGGAQCRSSLRSCSKPGVSVNGPL